MHSQVTGLSTPLHSAHVRIVDSRLQSVACSSELQKQQLQQQQQQQQQQWIDCRL